MAQQVAQVVELDPLIVKGIHLLHSRSKDSAEQLQNILEEVLRQASDGSKCPKTPTVYVKREVPVKTESVKVGVKISSASKELVKDAEKRTIARVSGNDSDGMLPSKRPRSDSPSSSNSSDEHALEMDPSHDELAREILEMDISCIVCKGMEVGVRNQLVECQECHSLYHQECHNPPILDQNVNDPRVVWYCASCTKSMKKLAVKPQKTGGRSRDGSESSRSLLLSKTESPSSATNAAPLFKRVENKGSSSGNGGQSQSGGSKPVGMAALAASLKQGGSKLPVPGASVSKSMSFTSQQSNVSGKSYGTLMAAVKPSSSSSSVSSKPSVLAKPSSGTGTPPLIMTADKRLQIMKKRAAKMHEKRKLPK